MKIFKYILFAFFTITYFTGCEEEIEWEEEPIPEMLVVEGAFTNELKKHTITLNSSASYFSDKKTPKVSGADVSITDGVNTYFYIENPGGSGNYETIDPVSGVPGNTYTLNIYLEQAINGETHYYSTGTLNMGIKLDSLNVWLYDNPFYFEGSFMDSLITVFDFFGQEPGGIHNFYEFKYYKNDTVLNDTIDESSVVSDVQGMDGGYFHSLYSTYQFDKNEKVSLEILSVEESYVDFLTGIMNIANQSADPFNMSGPPANALGNIEGTDAIGYFKVAYTSKATAYAKTEPFPFD